MKIIEYKTTVKKCSDIGVPEAIIPTKPHGFGWVLVNGYLAENSFYYLWQRINPFQKREV